MHTGDTRHIHTLWMYTSVFCNTHMTIFYSVVLQTNYVVSAVITQQKLAQCTCMQRQTYSIDNMLWEKYHWSKVPKTKMTILRNFGIKLVTTASALKATMLALQLIQLERARILSHLVCKQVLNVVDYTDVICFPICSYIYWLNMTCTYMHTHTHTLSSIVLSACILVTCRNRIP